MAKYNVYSTGYNIGEVDIDPPADPPPTEDPEIIVKLNPKHVITVKKTYNTVKVN